MSQARKKVFLVNRDFQLRYAYAAVFVGVVSTVVTAIVLLYPLYTFEILRIPRFLPLPVLFGMIGAALFNIFAVALLGVFITHRIAGPMYSLVRSMRRVELGIWAGHMRLREGDDLRYVVRNFNQMIDGLVQTGRQDLQQLEQITADIEKSSVQEALAKLKIMSESVAARLKEAPLEGLLVEGRGESARNKIPKS